jgi:hypothetical protein
VESFLLRPASTKVRSMSIAARNWFGFLSNRESSNTEMLKSIQHSIAHIDASMTHLQDDVTLIMAQTGYQFEPAIRFIFNAEFGADALKPCSIRTLDDLAMRLQWSAHEWRSGKLYADIRRLAEVAQGQLGSKSPLRLCAQSFIPNLSGSEKQKRNYTKQQSLKEAIDAYDELTRTDQLEYLMFQPLGVWAFTNTLYTDPGTVNTFVVDFY